MSYNNTIGLHFKNNINNMVYIFKNKNIYMFQSVCQESFRNLFMFSYLIVRNKVQYNVMTKFYGDIDTDGEGLQI